MTVPGDRRTVPAAADSSPLAIVCGSGTLPCAVAEAATRAGRKVVLFPLRGSADPDRLSGYVHHWIGPGQFGRFRRIALAEGIRDVVFIGGVVRPPILHVWPDLRTLLLAPRLLRLGRGGDNRLLSGIGAILEEQGFRVLGAHEIAPEILMPSGSLASRRPSERDRSDIEQGLRLLRAIGPYDVGQAVVVADGRVLAIEAAEGTDEMLARLADLRQRGRIRHIGGTGVLVKAPKPIQDRRFDLPSIGPLTIDGAARAALSGIAVVAGSAVVAEPAQVAAAAERARLFVIGIPAAQEQT